MAAYANDLIIKRSAEDQVNSTEIKLIDDGKVIGLNVNQVKTEYMIISRRHHQLIQF